MMIGEEPWEDYHHHSLPSDTNEDYSNELVHPSLVYLFLNFVRVDLVDYEHNLSNI